MKKLRFLIAALALLAIVNTTKAQAWEKETKLLGVGFGASYFLRFDPDGYYGRRIPFSRITGQFNFYGEFGIHKYVGLGFTTGIGGASRFGGYYPEVNVPIGMLCNFHFYQLIADKTSKDIHADKLDIYAGINVGSGVAVIFDTRNSNAGLFPIFFAGPHVGIRYYFTDRVGVTGELGYGRSLLNAGFVFKL